MEAILVLIGFICGVGVGVGVLLKRTRRNIIGTLRVDHSDPQDDPYLFLELNKPLSEFISKKYVTLKVNIKNFISQK